MEKVVTPPPQTFTYLSMKGETKRGKERGRKNNKLKTIHQRLSLPLYMYKAELSAMFFLRIPVKSRCRKKRAIGKATLHKQPMFIICLFLLVKRSFKIFSNTV